ncbi:hypothetical protein FA13DRAFT_728809 [Coprinellus micaceus]|uniref:Uncharacterized protein n=1 Tax=Coprinellus micaceus TaxID=71717 RepID=A0A4Y7TVH0_COPMI|nr:hypothetical protein FA13DRAFT_728809 [Coprinellus micaceus]
MDWRAMSRSRSRISMDWRPTSRSRSRPPETTTSFDQSMHDPYGNNMHMGGYGGMGYGVNLGAGGYGAGGGFGAMGMGGFPASAPNPSTGVFEEIEANHQQQGPAPMGRMGLPVGMGRRSPAGNFQMQQQQFAGMSQYHQSGELSVLYESAAYEVEGTSGSVFENGESRYAGMRGYEDEYSAPASSGYGSLSKLSIPSHHGPEGFNRHVRKTSFDHTVVMKANPSGLMSSGPLARHPANGKAPASSCVHLID